MQKAKISVCLVIYNEEKIIERALKSVAGLVDEIIVVHDGPCSDNSLKICRKYGAKIFIQPHIGEAEPHRVFTLEKAKNKWIFQLDADEYLSPKLQIALPKLIADPNVSCYEFIWPFFDGQKYLTTNWPFKKALFRKDKISFAAFPHSEVLVNGEIKRVPLRLEHKPGYDNYTFATFKNKHLKWARIHAKYLLMDPKKLLTFPKNKKVPLPRYYLVVNHPYLLALPLATYQGLQAIKTNGISAGWLGVKNSLVIFFYYLFLALEVGKLQKNRYNKSDVRRFQTIHS